jgi:hypothetical protein
MSLCVMVSFIIEDYSIGCVCGHVLVIQQYVSMILFPNQNTYCFHQDKDIKPQRSIGNIPNVISCFDSKIVRISAMDLSISGNAWFDGKKFFLPFFIACNFVRHVGTRSHKGHVSAKDTSQTRKFID